MPFSRTMHEGRWDMLDKEKFIHLLNNVVIFLEELPDKIKTPELYTSTKEDITSVRLEWYNRPSQLVEVEVTMDSYFYVALIIDDKKTIKEHGDCKFKSGIDKKLVKLIERVSCLMK